MGRVIGATFGETLGASRDAAALLDFAWAMEPALGLNERWAALDRLEEIIARGEAPPAPPGRDWAMEVMAERAFDAAAYVRLTEAQDLATTVLREADPGATIARARATLALGRALAWVGTDEATRRGDERLREAIELFRLLGHSEWLGFTLFWRGHAVCFQNGDLDQAAELIREGLEVLGPDSLRRAPVLTFYSDVLCERGDLDAADAVLDEAAVAAERDGFPRSRAYIAWSRAHVSAARDDGARTRDLLSQVEIDAGDWFATMAGLDFLADAAVLLDRVGRTAEAARYLERARERVAREGGTTRDGTQIDEPVRVAQASLLARSGDARSALTQLEELVRGNWLEKRLTWRNTMLTAWATLRAGAREDAGAIAARALAEAADNGGVSIALAGEGVLTRALLPLADEAGCTPARRMLLDGAQFTIRLFGAASILTADGTPVLLPAGRPVELVRWLALSGSGLPSRVVLSTFFPDVDRGTALQRLRQVLRRIRAEAGDLVLRDGEQLTLVPVWVDVRAFGALAAAARRSRGTRRLELAWAATALAQRGPLLASDPYAAWGEAAREECAEILAELVPMTVGPSG